MSVEDTERLNELKSNEREFALLLLSKGLEVYPEPVIQGCTALPDFFVVNPKTGTGKIVEITLREKSSGKSKNRKTFLRKQRQTEELKNTGIPCIFLYRENQEKIRNYIWSKLF